MDNKYKYTYEKTADYCYNDTDVLINKLNITNDEDLFNAERELVSLRTYELNEKPNIKILYPCHCVSLKAKIEMAKKLDINEVGVGLEINI